VPLGTSYLAETGQGVDLAPLGYVEEEFLVRGTATEWSYDSAGAAIPRTHDVPYCTRVLLRRPADPARFSGVIQVEPLHPDLDSGLTWRALHPWITRTGAAWAGLTEIADNLLGGLPGRPSMYLSGWSITGSFCRVFLGDGFHERYRLDDGQPVFDGYVVAISSGGAGPSGYAPISSGTEPPGPDDPRRTTGPHDVPVIELLSEYESETHARHLRPDSDAPADRYRLYQVAGTSHINHDVEAVLTNTEQCRARGLPTSEVAINETRSDARLDFVARAVFALLDRWVARGEAPPHVVPFGFAPEPDAPGATQPGARPLLRDSLGNVRGVHATPAADARPSPSFPQFSAALRAALVGYLDLLDAGQLRELYGSRQNYLARYQASCTRLVGEGLLLQPEARTLLQQAAERDLPRQ
jgi:hypothetical protein